MAVTIVATEGAANANSYATVAEADAELDLVYGADEWEGLSDDDKGRLLIAATRAIDNLAVKYNSATTTQALNFPLEENADGENGFEEASFACIKQAFWIYQTHDAVQEAKIGGISGLTSENLGAISKTVTGFNIFGAYESSILSSLADFIDLSQKIKRG